MDIDPRPRQAGAEETIMTDCTQIMWPCPVCGIFCIICFRLWFFCCGYSAKNQRLVQGWSSSYVFPTLTLVRVAKATEGFHEHLVNCVQYCRVEENAAKISANRPLFVRWQQSQWTLSALYTHSCHKSEGKKNRADYATQRTPFPPGWL